MRDVRINYKDHPLFWDPEPDSTVSLGEHLLPKGLLFAFNPFQKAEITPQALLEHQKLVDDATTRIMAEPRDDEAAQILA